MAVINKSLLLKSLNPPSPTLTGIVSAVNADDTSVVTMTGGGTLLVVGSSVAVSGVALIKDQEIIGEAQALAAFTLDV